MAPVSRALRSSAVPVARSCCPHMSTVHIQITHNTDRLQLYSLCTGCTDHAPIIHTVVVLGGLHMSTVHIQITHNTDRLQLYSLCTGCTDHAPIIHTVVVLGGLRLGLAHAVAQVAQDLREHDHQRIRRWPGLLQMCSHH